MARTARQRVRQEIAQEILAAARAQLASNGAAGLSLRSVARELDMVPSALYRYFPGRDALLGALILAAYESLAGEAEQAAAQAADQATSGQRWSAVPRAVRRWALAHPHEWGLIFGTPVPGYEAPEATVAPYARIAAALARPAVEAQRAGRLAPVGPPPVDDALVEAVAPVIGALCPDLPPGAVARLIAAWATLVGTISLEVFGHWRNTVLDPGALFDDTVQRLAGTIGLD